MNSEVRKLPQKWRNETSGGNTETLLAEGYDACLLDCADELEAAIAADTPKADEFPDPNKTYPKAPDTFHPSHAWPAVDRVLMAAFNAGYDCNEFDFIAARKLIHDELAALCAALSADREGEAGVTFPMSDEALAAAIQYAGERLYDSGHQTERYKAIVPHYSALLDAQAKRAALVLAVSQKGEENGNR